MGGAGVVSVNLSGRQAELTDRALIDAGAEGRIGYMTTYLKTTKAILPVLALLCAAGASLSAGTLSADATFTDSMVSPGVYQYDLTLNNTGSTTIGTFWFSWVPGLGFMTVTPTDIVSPAGWTPAITNSGASIQFVDSGTLLAAGSSLSGFEFDSTLTPAELEAPSASNPADPVATSFVYIAAPFGDPGFQLVATPAQSAVPEPGTILLTAAGIGLAFWARRITARRPISPLVRR